MLAHVQPARCARRDLGHRAAGYIGRVRTLARLVAQAYYDSREALGFPDVQRAKPPHEHATRSRRAAHRRAAAEGARALGQGIRRRAGAGARTGRFTGCRQRDVSWFATPRRLAVQIPERARRRAGPRRVESHGPSVKAGSTRQASRRRRCSVSRARTASPSSARAARYAEGQRVLLSSDSPKGGRSTAYLGYQGRGRVARRCRYRKSCAGAPATPNSCGRCMASSCCTARASCRERCSGLKPQHERLGPSVPERGEYRDRQRGWTTRRCSQKRGWSIAGFDKRGRRSQKQLPRSAAGNARPRAASTRCSTKSPRWSNGPPSTKASSAPSSSRCRRNA